MYTHQSPKVDRTSSDMSADTQSVAVPVEQQMFQENVINKLITNVKKTFIIKNIIVNTLLYNTDTEGSWGIGQIKLSKDDHSFEDILNRAIEERAHVIVEPSRGKYWYIKGFNNAKTTCEIQKHLDEMTNVNYKNKSKTLFITYNCIAESKNDSDSDVTESKNDSDSDVTESKNDSDSDVTESKNDSEYTTQNNLYITPISKKDNKKHKPNRDYKEQLENVNKGKFVYWDGPSPKTKAKSKSGDYFMFWFYEKEVRIHKIINVYDPKYRLPSWSDNVGHSDRNVVELSSHFETISWDDYIQQFDGYKRCMGTGKVRDEKAQKIINFLTQEF
jgi:hypothetical protein